MLGFKNLLQVSLTIFNAGLLCSCVSWPDEGRGGFAEHRLEDMLSTEAGQPFTAAHGLRYDYSILKNQLDILTLQGARYCFPAAVLQAELLQVRIARELVAKLYSDVSSDIVVQRQKLAQLERQLVLVLAQGECVIPRASNNTDFIADASNSDSKVAYAEQLITLLNSDNQFATDSDLINPKYAMGLNTAAQLLKGNQEWFITITGYADERGGVEHNLALSVRRAKAVEQLLINGGLQANQMFVTARGSAQPLYVGSDESVLLVNRAVVIELISREKLQ